jgi:gliding motility-associated-like protein
MYNKLLLFILPFLFFTTINFAQITVTNSAVANTLVAKLVGTGVSYSNPTLTCASNGAGFFVSTNAMLGIDSGIVLTTGYAKDNAAIVGVNNFATTFASEDRNFNVGDADLYNLAYTYNTSLSSTDINDVCKLEFDFIPQGDTIRFKYKFGSEEYPDYVCSEYNDYFAFFITGTPGYPTPKNLALVPGTNIPVTINSINNGVVGGASGNALSYCTNMGAGSPFTGYYQNTSTSNTVVYNGTTVLLESKAAVTPCSTYHMKFLVADILDHIFDSGVFLKSGSFKSDGILFDSIHSPTALPIGWPYSTEGCNSDTIYVKRALPKPFAQIVYITLGGTAINGVDYISIPATVTIPANDTIAKIVVTPILDGLVEATETLTIGLSSSNCTSIFSDTMTLLINEFPAFSVTDNDTICIGQTKTLSTNLAFANTDITFKWLPFNIIGNTINITPLSTGTYTVSGRYPGCPNRDSTVKINVANIPSIYAGIDTNICIGSSYTINAFGNTTAPYPITYNWSPAATLSNNNLLTTIATPLATTAYTITATNSAGCTKTATIAINARPSFIINNTISPVNCANTNGTITVSNTASPLNLSYILTPNNDTNTNGIFANLTGNQTYTVSATSTNYCNTSTAIFVSGVTPVLITNFNKTNITCFGLGNGNVNITASGVGIINYVLQPNNITNTLGAFASLSFGTYTIIATDAANCFTSTIFTIAQPNLLSMLNISGSATLCNGANNGNITAMANGGTGLLSYLLLPNNTSNNAGTFSSLTANSYTVVATDINGCSTNSAIIITQSNAIIVDSIIKTLAKCNPLNSGSATIYASGGFGLLSYTANNGAGIAIGNVFNNLINNSYTLTITDANSCTKTQVFSIGSVLPPQFAGNTITNVSCFNGNTGAITCNIINSNASITFTISPNITNTNNGSFTNAVAGIYTITMIDANGCTGITTATITHPNPIVINSLTSTPTLCNNTPTGTITINASGGTGVLNYFLINNSTTNTNGNFTALGASNYTIQIIDANNCTTQTNIAVVQPSSLSWASVTNTNVNCAGGSNASINVAAIGGTSVISYYLNGVLANPPYTNLVASNYTINASDINGCSISTVVIVSQPNVLLFSNINSTALSCVPGNDAIIASSLIGGTLPFSFVLNGGSTNNTGSFTNLGANNYTIVATDNLGCSTTTFININPPTLPNIASVTAAPTGCIPNNTGTAIANVSNAQPSFVYTISNTYQSSNTFTSLLANTYTLIVKDTLNCKDTAIFTINTTPNPTINAPIITPASCVPGCDGVANITVSGGTGTITYLLNATTQTSNVFMGLCKNNYLLTITDANGCTATSNTLVASRPNPTITNIIANNVTCNGLNNGAINCTTSGGTLNYNYTINGLANGQNNIFDSLAPNNYTIIVSDFYGCADTANQIIGQPAVLQINNITTSMPSCFNGNNGTINCTSTGGTGAVNYSINNSTPQANGNFNNLIGNATYTINITDANNCTSVSTIFIAQPPALLFTSMVTDSATCWSATNGSLATTAIGGTGVITYSIYPSNANNTSGVFPNLLGSIYYVTIIDGNGCTTSTTTIVGQPPILTINNINGLPVTCSGNNNASITSNAIGGVGSYTYLLINSNISNTTGSFNNLSGAIYTIQVTDAVSCSTTATLSIFEPNLLQFTTVFKQNVFCNSDTNGSISVAMAGGNGGNTFNILPSVLGNNTTGSFFPLPSNNYTITTTDVKGCSISTVVNITQPNILINTIISTLPPTCNNSSNGFINVIGSGGTVPYTYTLSPLNISNNNGQFANLSGNNYTITLVDGNNCNTTISVNLPKPFAILIDSIAIKPVICFGENTGSVSINAVGGTGTLLYNLTPLNITNNTGEFLQLFGGVYTVTVTDMNNCTTSTFVNITQNPKISISNLTTINPYCSGGTQGQINITATGGLAPLSYSFNNGIFNNTNNFINLILGNYTIAIKDITGCSIDTIVSLNSPLALVLRIDSFKNIQCIGTKDASIYAQAIYGNAGGYTYILLPNNTVNNTGIFNNLNQGTYTVIARDNLGCEGMQTISLVGTSNTLSIDFEITPISCVGYGKDGILLAKTLGGKEPFTYQWNVPTSINTASIDSLSYGFYVVQVTDDNGCTIRDSILMPASPCCEVFLPNVFTPNGDGKNDEFLAFTSASVQVLQFDIYDRFGNKVFGTIQKEKGWDGTFKNTAMDMDTYFYLYQYKCLGTKEIITKKGDVILAR